MILIGYDYRLPKESVMDTCDWNADHRARPEDMLVIPWSGKKICPNCQSACRALFAPA